MPGPVVAVTGATGQQGRAVVRALLEDQADVVALVRDGTAGGARALTDAGARVRAVTDLSDADAVLAALDGVGSVFVMATMTGPDGIEGEVAMGRATVDAVARSDADFLLYSSVGGAERSTGVPHFESKRRIEEHVEQAGTPYSLLRPVFFMDNLASVLLPSVEDGTIVVRMPLAADVPLQMVAVRDIGVVAAALLLDPDRAPATLEIGGDELTGEQIAAAFGRRFGVPSRYEALPLDVLDDDDQRAMFGWFAQPPAYRMDADATRSLDPGVLSLDAWLREQPDDLLGT